MAGSSEQCPHGMGSPEWCSLCKNDRDSHDALSRDRRTTRGYGELHDL